MVKITERGSCGLRQYGQPVATDYGEKVEVYESSAVKGPHCWLRIFDDGDSVIADHRGRSMTAHLAVEQAVAIRDRLAAFIDEVTVVNDYERLRARAA